MPIAPGRSHENLFEPPGTAQKLFEEMRAPRSRSGHLPWRGPRPQPGELLSKERIPGAGQLHEIPARLGSKKRSAQTPRMKRITAWLCLPPTITLLGYLFYVADRIERQSVIDESQPADVILVMGARAATGRGRPSPVLQGRVEPCSVAVSEAYGSLHSDDRRRGGRP